MPRADRRHGPSENQQQHRGCRYSRSSSFSSQDEEGYGRQEEATDEEDYTHKAGDHSGPDHREPPYPTHHSSSSSGRKRRQSSNGPSSKESSVVIKEEVSDQKQ
jgi:hypothetical protein